MAQFFTFKTFLTEKYTRQAVGTTRRSNFKHDLRLTSAMAIGHPELQDRFLLHSFRKQSLWPGIFWAVFLTLTFLDVLYNLAFRGSKSLIDGGRGEGPTQEACQFHD